MDWFERLTGFRETTYNATRAKLSVAGHTLTSSVNAASWGIGTLELVSLQTLRARAHAAISTPGRLKLSIVTGNVRTMHHAPSNAGALFQVASQFNLLEMASPGVTPEQGVTRYHNDHTQGPACAIAAGAATIYRNYFTPVAGTPGQTATRQLDGLADLGQALASATGLAPDQLWTMQNGYALLTQRGLDAIADHLATLSASQTEALRGTLRIGLHTDVEVTDAPGPTRPHVSQAFCSALPVAYTHPSLTRWEPFATLILQAAYEATLHAATLNARRGASNIVFLTLLGGGAFGNHEDWIYAAITAALNKMRTQNLDVRLVSFGAPPSKMLALVNEFR